jgi:hypothetical protein
LTNKNQKPNHDDQGKKEVTTVLTNRIDKEEWVFPTMAASNFSGLVVEVTGRDPETGEGVGNCANW